MIDSRELWHRKIEALNRQIEELVETRDALYRSLSKGTISQINDGDYHVINEPIDTFPRFRNFT